MNSHTGSATEPDEGCEGGGAGLHEEAERHGSGEEPAAVQDRDREVPEDGGGNRSRNNQGNGHRRPRLSSWFRLKIEVV